MGDEDSPSSARLESCAIKLPNKNKVIPRTAWNAVGCSAIKLGLSNEKRVGTGERKQDLSEDLTLIVSSRSGPGPPIASHSFPFGNIVVEKDLKTSRAFVEVTAAGEVPL